MRCYPQLMLLMTLPILKLAAIRLFLFTLIDDLDTWSSDKQNLNKTSKGKLFLGNLCLKFWLLFIAYGYWKFLRYFNFLMHSPVTNIKYT